MDLFVVVDTVTVFFLNKTYDKTLCSCKSYLDKKH